MSRGLHPLVVARWLWLNDPVIMAWLAPWCYARYHQRKKPPAATDRIDSRTETP